MRLEGIVHIVDCHAEGEAGHVVVGGIPAPSGATLATQRDHLRHEQDWVRTRLLHEPRGSAAHHLNLLVPPMDPSADLGFIIVEPTEYPAMSGSNAMCVATVALETGILPALEPVTHLRLETPAGVIEAECRCRDGKVTSVQLTNRPALVHHLDARVEVPGLGTLTVDVAYGGMTYAIVDAASLGLDLVPDRARELCEVGERIKRAAAAALPVSHPEDPTITGISQTLFTGPLERDAAGLESTNAVVISPGRVDRSPCGTGTSARLAVLHARGQIQVGERFVHRSLIGSRFESRIDALTTVGEHPAIVPSISGRAWITGTRQVGYHPDDPFADGHTVGDLWFDMSTHHL